ncbi:hypothetical protein GEO21_22715, partial [Sphingobacterium faecium]|uniref:hypothetical protein n=1 Tax=Sphingobacterium faecium TaxID=34087 RepID=UPI00129097C7
MKQIKYTDKITNRGTTPSGVFSANDANEIKKVVNDNANEVVNNYVNKADYALGVTGNISVEMTLTQLNALNDGVYEAQTSGMYANSLVAKEGYYTRFKKEGLTWLLYSETKMPKIFVDGQIVNDNYNAVSGNEIYNTFNKVVNIPNVKEISFILRVGEALTATGDTNTSVNWLSTQAIPCLPNKDYTIRGYGADSTSGSRRIIFRKSNAGVISVLPSTGFNNYFTFTTPSDCVDFKINVAGATNVGNDIPNSPYWNTFKVYDGEVNNETAEIYVKGEGVKGDILTEQITNIESTTKFIDSITILKKETQTITLTTGAIGQSGATANTPSYRRTSVTSSTSMVKYNPNKIYTYTGAIRLGDTYTGVSYRDENFALVGFDCYEGGKTYSDYILYPPSSTFYIATCSYLADPIINTEEKTLKSSTSNGNITVYIDSQYIGNSNGTENNPYKSVAEAIEKIEGDTTFMILFEENREILPLADLPSGNFKFTSPKGKKVVFYGSNKLTDWSKTSNHSNVYQTSYNGTIINASRFGRIIYENYNPSRPIISNERHPLQKALSYRLPFTAIKEVASIALVESTPGSYFYNSTASLIYLHPTNSVDPIINGFSYEIAQRNFNTAPQYNTKKNINISMHNIQFMFGNDGLLFRGFENVKRENISVLGVIGAGAFRDDTSNIISINDEAGYCNGDGINGHFSSFSGYQNLNDHRSMQPVCIYFDPWVHDNWDDGMSHHENHRVTVHGLLTEYNDDGGVRASNDSNYTIYSGYARKNGLITGAGEGFSVVNPTLNPLRNGCKMVIYNSFSEGNAIGYAAISDVQNQIELINCISRNNVDSELKARAGAKIIVRNSYATNANVSKIKVVDTGGIIEVKNDTLI